MAKVFNVKYNAADQKGTLIAVIEAIAAQDKVAIDEQVKSFFMKSFSLAELEKTVLPTIEPNQGHPEFDLTKEAKKHFGASGDSDLQKQIRDLDKKITQNNKDVEKNDTAKEKNEGLLEKAEEKEKQADIDKYTKEIEELEQKGNDLLEAGTKLDEELAKLQESGKD